MCNSAQAGKQTTSAMLGEANQPLAGDPVGRVCLRGVLAGIVTSLAFAAPAWASNPPIAGTAGVANVPTVVANADRTAESTVASAAALPPQSPHGAAVEQAPVSATAKQAIGDAAHAVSGAAAPTSTVAPALEGAAQATHTAGQGVAPLITAATAGVKASQALATTTQAVEDASKGLKGLAKGAVAAVGSASYSAAGALAPASRAAGALAPAGTAAVATVRAAQGGVAPAGQQKRWGPGVPAGSHGGGGGGVDKSGPKTPTRPISSPASRWASGHFGAGSGQGFTATGAGTHASVAGFAPKAVRSCEVAVRAGRLARSCHGGGARLVSRPSPSPAPSSLAAASAPNGAPWTGPPPQGIEGRLSTAGPAPTPLPSNPVPGGVSGSATAGGLALTTFLALAVLCLLAAPRVVSRLRLLGEPGLPAPFVLIPERPG